MLDLEIPLLISRIVTLLIAFTFHEFSHAFTAVRLGDNTPRLDGRLTLNPLKHLDPWGCLMLLAAGFGWAKPVRVDPYAVTRKNKAGMMIVAFAGPLANLLLAAAGAILIRSGLFGSNSAPFGLTWLPSPLYFLSQFIWTNLNLMVFNLVPIAPL
ncbi:MAG: site-2 protease family protein, partial [Anaerolineaceae bacterium]|nr:site-2 protease family protein [Anaerolineaceae bacterium]